MMYNSIGTAYSDHLFRNVLRTDLSIGQTPSHQRLVWHDCYGDFKCARLQVPMDWLGTSEEAEKTVEIAVIKVEATVPVTDASYGGAVVLNPGLSHLK